MRRLKLKSLKCKIETWTKMRSRVDAKKDGCPGDVSSLTISQVLVGT